MALLGPKSQRERQARRLAESPVHQEQQTGAHLLRQQDLLRREAQGRRLHEGQGRRPHEGNVNLAPHPQHVQLHLHLRRKQLPQLRLGLPLTYREYSSAFNYINPDWDME